MQNRFLLVALVAGSLIAAVAATAAAAQNRPKITGISHMAVYTSDATATEHYYTVIVGAAKLPTPKPAGRALYAEPDAVH